MNASNAPDQATPRLAPEAFAERAGAIEREVGRVIVGHLPVMGWGLLGLAVLGGLYAWRGTLTAQRWLLRLFVPAVFLPYVANQAGWVASEVGRQPWVVYGLLRTRDAVSPNVAGEHVLVSIVLFSFVYLGLLAVWLFVMNEKVQHGPETEGELVALAALTPEERAQSGGH